MEQTAVLIDFLLILLVRGVSSRDALIRVREPKLVGGGVAPATLRRPGLRMVAGAGFEPATFGL